MTGQWWVGLPDWAKLLATFLALGFLTYTANQIADRYAGVKGRKGFV